jgi:hypothetical protein
VISVRIGIVVDTKVLFMKIGILDLTGPRTYVFALEAVPQRCSLVRSVG